MRTISLALLSAAMLIAGGSPPSGAQAPAPANPPAEAAPAASASPAVATPAPAVPAPAPAAPAEGAPPPAPPASAPSPAAPAAASGPVYVVTYFNVAPAASRKAMGMLRPFAAATRKESGNTELTELHELNRTGHFAILEGWRDKAAFDAHDAAMKALGDKLRPLFTSPFDSRQFVPLVVPQAAAAAAAGGNPASAVWVLTHVDVFPKGKDEVAAMVNQLVDDSRKEPGAQRFDAMVWDGHANHFHLVEAWADRKSFEAHAAADHTKAFRARLVPFEGAFYDERLYEVVR